MKFVLCVMSNSLEKTERCELYVEALVIFVCSLSHFKLKTYCDRVYLSISYLEDFKLNFLPK